MHYFIQTVQLNVLVTHYGIRRLHSNTLRVGLPCRDILLGRVPLGKAAWRSRHSQELTRQKGREKAQSSHAESDSHYQLRLFLFLSTTTVNHTVTGSQGWREWKGEGEGEIKGNFHQKELSFKTSEMNVPWSWVTVGLLKMLWTDEDLYVFNGKRASSKWLKALGEKETRERENIFHNTVVVRGVGCVLARFSPLFLLPRSPVTNAAWLKQWGLDAVPHEPLNLPTLWAEGKAVVRGLMPRLLKCWQARDSESRGAAHREAKVQCRNINHIVISSRAAL